jgi:hypothetical protein
VVEEVEVTADVGLHDVARVEQPEAALELRRRRRPRRGACRELLVAHDK